MALFGAKKTQDNQDEQSDKKQDSQAKTVKKAVKKENPSLDNTEKSMKDLYAEEATKKTGRSKKNTSTSNFDGAFRTLVKPLVTEKATELSAQNKYAFVVNTVANKIEVAKAVYAVYGVKPLNVNIISMKGKTLTRGRIKGKRKDWKKAIVTLKKGESIKIYEGV
jgi:large subunit ribosomal protein L23